MTSWIAERVSLVDEAPTGITIECERASLLTRCRDCHYAHEAPPVEGWHLECCVRPLCRHYTPDDGFCHLGTPREEADHAGV